MQGSAHSLTLVYENVLGEQLSLTFSPDGSLSSASLGEYDVTTHLRYLREKDHAEALQWLGFRKQITEKERQVGQEIMRRLGRAEGFSKITVVDTEEREAGLFAVSLSSTAVVSNPHRPINCKFLMDGRTFRCIEFLRLYNCGFASRLNSFLLES